LVIRCWEPHDAAPLKDAIDSSIDHLRPWMDWAADEPQPLTQKVELLRRFRDEFDLGKDFHYGLFSADKSRILGGSGLHPRLDADAFAIGYWIRVGQTGRGLATEAAAALTRVGLEFCGGDRVEIRVEPENEPSLAVPRKLGFHEEATLRRRLNSGRPPNGARRDVVVFSMLRDQLPGSPAAAVAIEAFDAAGMCIT
jgi:RimJ/RimL family protein N-acetyltransferase